jgi:hypothetical protein
MNVERVENLGPSPAPEKVANVLQNEITEYVAELLHTNLKNLDDHLPTLANVTIELGKTSAKSAEMVMSKNLKETGEIVETILENRHVIPGLDKPISLLEASKVYEQNPSSPELKKVLETFLTHQPALGAMVHEFKLATDLLNKEFPTN